MYSFPNLEPVCYSMSGSNYWFLTCIRFLRKQVMWSGIPISWRIFQFVVTHTVKGFGVINKAEVDVCLELSCFFFFFYMIQRMLGIWSLVPLPFLKPAWTSGSWWFMYCWRLSWRLSWRILSIALQTLIWVKLCDSLNILWHWLSLGLEWKHLFLSYGHCWVFQICWHTECSILMTSSLRIWNSSVGIPSPPLASFIVMLLRPTWLQSPGCLALGD